MMRSRILLLPAALLGVVALAAPSRPITLAYRLPKKAPLVRPTLPTTLLAGPVHVEVVDARPDEDKDVVGVQREKDDIIYQWRSKSAVPASVGGFVAAILKGWSVPVGEGGATLAIKLERYWVDEKSVTFGSAYAAEVRLSAALVGSSGETSWTHPGEGKAGYTAVDGRESTCNELLSTALYDAMTQAIGTTDEPAPAAKPAAPEVVEPQALLDGLVRLKSGGVGEDVLAAYVKQRRLARPLTVDEILDWKNAGMPDAVIKLAQP
jgi:hypothetical protein